jgi:hypothetical protein
MLLYPFLLAKVTHETRLSLMQKTATTRSFALGNKNEGMFYGRRVPLSTKNWSILESLWIYTSLFTRLSLVWQAWASELLVLKSLLQWYIPVSYWYSRVYCIGRYRYLWGAWPGSWAGTPLFLLAPCKLEEAPCEEVAAPHAGPWYSKFSCNLS